MLVPATTMPIALDVTTLFLVATCVTGLLGLASTLRRESPSLDTERVFLNARRISDSVLRIGQMVENQAM